MNGLYEVLGVGVGGYPGDDGCWTLLLEWDAAVQSSDVRSGLKEGPVAEGSFAGGV